MTLAQLKAKDKKEMMNNIVNVTYGAMSFSFSTVADRHAAGTFYRVFVKCFMEGALIMTHKISAIHSMSEFAAINYAGNKIIKNWVNIR